MPTRDIKDSVRTSRTLAAATAEAERCFFRLTTYADDFGRFPADAAMVRAHCFTMMLDKVRESHVASWLAELARLDLIRFYDGPDGKTYGFFPTWGKHQRTRAKHSKYPAPSSADICRQVPVDAAVYYREVPSTTENHRVPPGEPDSAAASAASRAGTFEAFWTAYPNKTGKDDALAVWLRGKSKAGRPIPTVDIVLAAIERAKASRDWTKDDGQYIPHPATWLRQGRWDDEGTRAAPTKIADVWAGRKGGEVQL